MIDISVRVAFIIVALFLPTASYSLDDKQARGLIRAADRAVMAGEIAAIVSTIPKAMGASFKTGDTLIEFDCRLFMSQKIKVQADRKAARATLANSRDLEKMGSIGKLEVTLAEAELEKTNAELAIAKLNVERCKVKAPFDGKVVQHFVKRHESVDLRQNLIEIVSSERLEVEVIVPGQWLREIKLGHEARITIDETGASAPVQITAISGAIDPVSQTVVMRGEILQPPSDLIPGMSGVLMF